MEGNVNAMMLWVRMKTVGYRLQLPYHNFHPFYRLVHVYMAADSTPGRKMLETGFVYSSVHGWFAQRG